MAQPERLDGRRVRREQNVEAVVDAMLDLLGEGVLSPGAAEVAERSGVSLRSVFRYFDDLDSLMERAIARQSERAAHLFEPLDADGTVAERAARLAAHRVHQHELLAPFAHAAVVRAPQHAALRSGLATRRDALRRQVELVFAPELDALAPDQREETLAALEAATSFDAVDLLRSHRHLAPARAEAALARAVTGILAGSGA
jgi:TetR/AcrR family transcriptional regulator, regulator of autoinduction and epiphytic fitness